MTTGIYQPDRSSKKYIYIIFFTTIFVGIATYVYTRPLVLETECSEIAEKTTGLTRSFNFNPHGDYELTKANCIASAAE